MIRVLLADDHAVLLDGMRALLDAQPGIEVVATVSNGRAEVGATLFLSPKTVDTYRSRMMHKLGIGDLAGLVKFAIQQGITQLE